MPAELLVIGNLAKDVIDEQPYYGGSAASIAVNGSYLGLDVSVASVLGQDTFSKEYISFLKDHKVDVSLVTHPLIELPVCQVVSIENNISNHEWIDNGSHPALDEISIEVNDLAKFNLVHLVSCPPILSLNIAQNTPRYSYEPGPLILQLPHYFNPNLVEKSSLIFFNEEEYHAALHISNTQNERDLIGSSNTTLVVTKGEHGSDIYWNVEGGFTKIHIDAIKGENDVIDPTGAGDCYKAGFLAGYLKGLPYERCGMIGSYLGSACVEQRGGILPLDTLLTAKRRYLT